ncbi:FapA family protein [bacterium]|nr:FapA family protein [bacterium]
MNIVTEIEDSIEVLDHDGSSWTIRVLLPAAKSSDQQILSLIRRAKDRIVDEYAVPVELLELGEILNKAKSVEGTSVTLSITRISDSQGKPRVHLLSLKTPRGNEFSDMMAAVDLFFMDEFDHVISVERIRRELQKVGVSPSLCDWKALEEKVQYVIKNRTFVNNFIIARGELPEEAVDAELEYNFLIEKSDSTDMDEYIDSRKMEPGDILCCKIPPRDGKRAGINVLGEPVPPMKGLDFVLSAGSGAKRSVDGNVLTASCEGVAAMVRTNRKVYTLAGQKVIPARIEVSVKPLLQINANELDEDVVLDGSVEISGTIRSGTTITSRGEIFLAGDIEEGATLRAGEDISVRGRIDGGEVSSDSSIVGNDGVKHSAILAGKNVDLDGLVEDSMISGRNVNIRDARGSHIIARQRVTLKRAGSNTTSQRTTVRVGKRDFYLKMIESNEKALEAAYTSYQHIVGIFGDDAVEQVNEANLQHILVKYINSLKKKSHNEPSQTRISTLKKLLGSVPVLKKIILEKNDELCTLKRKLGDENQGNSLIIVKEKLDDRIEVTMDDMAMETGPTTDGVSISADEETVKYQEMPAEKNRSFE